MEFLHHQSLDPAGRCVEGSPRLGDILVAAVPGERLGMASEALGALRRQFPWAPLVIEIRNFDPSSLADASRLAQRSAARVITPVERGFTTWRPRLLDVNQLPLDFTALLRLQRPRLPFATNRLIQRLVEFGSRGAPFGSVFPDLGTGLRAGEARLHRAGLPSPRRYYLFGHLATVTSALCRDRRLRIGDVVPSSRYADRACLARGFQRYLGTAPGRARKRIPWEWMAYRMELYGG